jgi:hypothetical protein
MKPTSPNSRNPDDLHPTLRKAWEAARDEWKKLYPNSPQPFLTQTYRSPGLQGAYYAQGREPLARVNEIRKTVGLPPLTAAENKRGETVTDAKPLQSKHQSFPARALDIAFTDIAGDEYKSVYPVPLFGKFAKLMLRHKDVRWGGNVSVGGHFKKLDDRPHFELAQ